jgi:hypothetical protein
MRRVRRFGRGARGRAHSDAHCCDASRAALDAQRETFHDEPIRQDRTELRAVLDRAATNLRAALNMHLEIFAKWTRGENPRSAQARREAGYDRLTPSEERVEITDQQLLIHLGPKARAYRSYSDAVEQLLDISRGA